MSETAAPSESQGTATHLAAATKRHRGRWLVLALIAVVLVVAGSVAYAWWHARADRDYLAALDSTGLAQLFPTDDAAITHAHAVCDALDAGGKAQGKQVDKVAVEAFCPRYADNFVVPKK